MIRTSWSWADSEARGATAVVIVMAAALLLCRLTVGSLNGEPVPTVLAQTTVHVQHGCGGGDPKMSAGKPKPAVVEVASTRTRSHTSARRLHTDGDNPVLKPEHRLTACLHSQGTRPCRPFFGQCLPAHPAPTRTSPWREAVNISLTFAT